MESENGGVAIARGWSIKSLDVMNKVAVLEDGAQLKYEKCLIATGVFNFLYAFVKIQYS